jgi:hypothetical protein
MPSKEGAMARPSTQKKDKPMTRHMFSKERMQADNGPGREDIERRAYELYLARGRVDGFAFEDWLRAEQELQSRPAQS